MALDPIPIGGQYTLSLTGLSLNGTALNSATVTYTLKNPDGTTVSGGTGTMSYVSASSGNYTATILASVTSLLTTNYRYKFDVVVTSGGVQVDDRDAYTTAYQRGLT